MRVRLVPGFKGTPKGKPTVLGRQETDTPIWGVSFPLCGYRGILHWAPRITESLQISLRRDDLLNRTQFWSSLLVVVSLFQAGE